MSNIKWDIVHRKPRPQIPPSDTLDTHSVVSRSVIVCSEAEVFGSELKFKVSSGGWCEGVTMRSVGQWMVSVVSGVSWDSSVRLEWSAVLILDTHHNRPEKPVEF